MPNIARPLLTNVPEGLVALPAHEYSPQGECQYCSEWLETQTYDQYVAQWYETEYEGPVVECDGYRWNPEPMSLEHWVYIRLSCTGV